MNIFTPVYHVGSPSASAAQAPLSMASPFTNNFVHCPLVCWLSPPSASARAATGQPAARARRGGHVARADGVRARRAAAPRTPRLRRTAPNQADRISQQESPERGNERKKKKKKKGERPPSCRAGGARGTGAHQATAAASAHHSAARAAIAAAARVVRRK